MNLFRKNFESNFADTMGGVTSLIFQTENFETSFPAEVTISTTNFDPDSTPIGSNISFPVVNVFLVF
jgi:hypothetical protein